MKLQTIIVFIVCLLIVGTAFIFIVEDNSDIANNIAETEEDPLLALGEDASYNDAVNAFSFNLFEKLLEDPENKENIFYSPYSSYTALAMAYEGAYGQTAEEMKKVLCINQDSEEFHEYMQTLYEYLNSEGDYDISTANALWPDDNFGLLQEYVNLIETVYGGESSEVDFSNPEEAVEIINQWVEDKTNNLIQDLLVPENVGSDTTLVLTNAIYFKGTWKVQFDKEDTINRVFETSQGDSISVPTMCMVDKDEEFNYFENVNMEILEMPYSGEDISMMIFLPKDDKDLTEIVKSMDHESYNELINSMSKTKLDIYLPKFTIETPAFSLKDDLIDLGMPTAFSGAADFSGIGPGVGWISDVLHKAFINVSEEGTEAAAATAIIFENATNINSKVVFDADHAFLFTIHHKETNTILFMGKVDNPLE